MSAISIVGVATETYTFGFMSIYMVPSFIPAMYFAGYVYLPVFFRLKVTTAYEVSSRVCCVDIPKDGVLLMLNFAAVKIFFRAVFPW